MKQSFALDKFRGTGRTTRQMKHAKPSAIFIWCNGNLQYPKELAKKLGREDLRIFRLSALDSDQLRGLDYPQIIIDHAGELTDRQREGLLRAYSDER